MHVCLIVRTRFVVLEKISRRRTNIEIVNIESELFNTNAHGLLFIGLHAIPMFWISLSISCSCV